MSITDQIKTITIAAVRSELTGTAFDYSVLNRLDEKDMQALYDFSSALDVSQFIGKILPDESRVSPVKEQFRKDALKAMYRCEKQMALLEQLGVLFDRERISYVPLKGAVLRHYYPTYWLRTSSDIDLLLTQAGCAAAEALLTEQLRFSFVERTTHDVVLCSPGGVHVELHHMLLESDSANKADKPLEDIWKHISPESGHYRCVMDDEAFYYYHIAHIAKHFLLGGGGIRPFADLFLLDAMPQYARKQTTMLEQGGLLTFAQSCSRLAAYWFADGEEDDAVLQMEDFLLRGTLYGSAHGKAVVGTVKSGSKLKRLLQRAWQPYHTIKHRYPVLIRHPVLLPLYELKRWQELLNSGRRGNLKDELVSGLTLSEEERKKISAMLEQIGL